MHWSLYLAALGFPAVAISSLLVGGMWTWALVVVAFGMIPAAELVMKPVTDNWDQEKEKSVREALVYRVIPQLFVPVQWSILLVFLWQVSSGSLSGWAELLGATASMGVCCGTFGINVGHELGHRRTKWEQGLAKASLMSSLYVHFFIEHNRGHHRRVATHDDPASARRGENVYGFWLRSVVESWKSAWDIDAKQMLRLQMVQAAVWGALLALAGPLAWGLAVVSAFLGILLLETVNYIEHYGLSRKVGSNGRPERVQPHHSWNSDHPVGRALLFELSRHSDHHAYPGRPYAVLRSFDHAPQFPTGYPGMILLSLVPPLFFGVMEPRVARWMESYA